MEGESRKKGHSHGFHRYAYEAMNTTFEMLIVTEDAAFARQRAREAFDELDRLERELSRFVSGSDVWKINRLPAGESIRVHVSVYECLQIALRAHLMTAGAFDPTIGALTSLWKPAIHAGTQPADADIQAALARTGLHRLRIHEEENRVTVIEPVDLDLGAIGKGYAVEQMVDLLRDWGVRSAVVHGGTSSVYALGRAPDSQPWRVGLGDRSVRGKSLGTLSLENRSLSASGITGEPHILDPATGRPSGRREALWLTCASPALGDAISTGLMVLADDEIELFCAGHPDVGVLLLGDSKDEASVKRLGGWD